MSDNEPDQPTVRSRVLAGGISEDKMTAYVAGQALLLDGEVVHDLHQPAPAGTRIVIAGH